MTTHLACLPYPRDPPPKHHTECLNRSRFAISQRYIGFTEEWFMLCPDVVCIGRQVPWTLRKVPDLRSPAHPAGPQRIQAERAERRQDQEHGRDPGLRGHHPVHGPRGQRPAVLQLHQSGTCWHVLALSAPMWRPQATHPFHPLRFPGCSCGKIMVIYAMDYI